jgi:hypothetical protein
MGDDKLLERATQLGRALFSQDRDLLAIASHWQHTGREFAGLVYAHQLRITIGEAVSDLELIAKALAPLQMRNCIEYIPF